MRTEVQKVLNELYHKDMIEVEKLNLVISYIEFLESVNNELGKKVAKMFKLLEEKNDTVQDDIQ